NFRTGTADKLGFGYESITKINPSNIYLSISGIGRTGPYKNIVGYDLMIQAYAGLMSVKGVYGRPPVKTGISVVDLTTGRVVVMILILSLHQKEKTGEGEYIDCSLLHSQIMMLIYLVPGYLATGKYPEPMGSGHPSLFPYQAFT